MNGCLFLFIAMGALAAVVVVQTMARGGSMRVIFGDDGPDETSDPGDGFGRDPVPLPLPEHPVGFALIREHDADFDTEGFYATVTDMFLAVHDAEAAGNVDPIRHLVRDEAWQTVRHGAADAGPGGLQVESLNATTVRREGDLDIVRVIIRARRPDGGGFQEYWTLERGMKVSTDPQASIWKCPNCGGPIDGDDRGTCGYCGVRLDDPYLDWVVTRIQAD